MFILVKDVTLVPHRVVRSAMNALATKNVEWYHRYLATIVAVNVHLGIFILFRHDCVVKLLIKVRFQGNRVD